MMQGKTLPLYEYKTGDDYLIIKKDNLTILKNNRRDLIELVNYRWALILETFNSSPRINKKVKIIDEREVRRNSLNKFRKYLDIENPQHICFLCNEAINESEL